MKELIGAGTILLSLLALLPYIRDTYRKTTIPHLFTEITALVILAIVFAGQLASGAEARAWSTGSTGILVIVVVLLALRNKATYKQITKVDDFLNFYWNQVQAAVSWAYDRKSRPGWYWCVCF